MGRPGVYGQIYDLLKKREGGSLVLSVDRGVWRATYGLGPAMVATATGATMEQAIQKMKAEMKVKL